MCLALDCHGTTTNGTNVVQGAPPEDRCKAPGVPGSYAGGEGGSGGPLEEGGAKPRSHAGNRGSYAGLHAGGTHTPTPFHPGEGAS